MRSKLGFWLAVVGLALTPVIGVAAYQAASGCGCGDACPCGVGCPC
jgi:hypothetical protein